MDILFVCFWFVILYIYIYIRITQDSFKTPQIQAAHSRPVSSECLGLCLATVFSKRYSCNDLIEENLHSENYNHFKCMVWCTLSNAYAFLLNNVFWWPLKNHFLKCKPFKASLIFCVTFHHRTENSVSVSDAYRLTRNRVFYCSHYLGLTHKMRNVINDCLQLQRNAKTAKKSLPTVLSIKRSSPSMQHLPIG